MNGQLSLTECNDGEVFFAGGSFSAVGLDWVDSDFGFDWVDSDFFRVLLGFIVLQPESTMISPLIGGGGGGVLNSGDKESSSWHGTAASSGTVAEDFLNRKRSDGVRRFGEAIGLAFWRWTLGEDLKQRKRKWSRGLSEDSAMGEQKWSRGKGRRAVEVSFYFKGNKIIIIFFLIWYFN